MKFLLYPLLFLSSLCYSQYNYQDLINLNPYSDENISDFVSELLSIDYSQANLFNNENFEEVWGLYYEDFSDELAQGWSWSGYQGACCGMMLPPPNLSNGSLDYSSCCGNGSRTSTLTSPTFNVHSGYEITSVSYDGGASANGIGSSSSNEIRYNGGSWEVFNGSIPEGVTSIQMRFVAYTSSWGIFTNIDNFQVVASNAFLNIPFSNNISEALMDSIYGCTDSVACNFSNIALVDNDSCEMPQPFYNCNNTCNNDEDNDGVCDEEEIFGCIDTSAVNFNPIATEELNDLCHYSTAFVESLFSSIAYYNGLSNICSENIESMATNNINNISSLQQALDTWNTSIDISSGWNMFGYGCPTSINLAEGLSNHTDKITIVKDNNGNVYMPEFEFNGIGDLTPGYGYQIKVTEEINDFSLCDWYVNDIPEDNIVSLQEEVENLNEENTYLIDSLGLINSQIGCTDSLACNFDISNLYDDGSCEFVSCVNCMDENACNYNSTASLDDGSCDYPLTGFDCEGFVIAEVGDQFLGGILFYVDSTFKHGLVAANVDIGSYPWGCYETSIPGSNDQGIGSGYSNTLEIISGCDETPIAASRSLVYVNGEFVDWYLPSYDELIEMFYSIGQGSFLGNIGGFDNDYYWSSSEADNNYAWQVYFGSGNRFEYVKHAEHSVRPIRSF